MDQQNQETPAPASWRELYPVHPCAAVFPMLPDDQLTKLGEDIKEHGLRDRIVLWQATDNAPYVVLDGRNRLEAMQRAGLTISPDRHDPMFTLMSNARSGTAPSLNVDPAAYVVSRNIHRRHLTKRERAKLIHAAVKAAHASQNDGAMLARSFNPTPGKRGGSTPDPVMAETVILAADHGISERTVGRAVSPAEGRPAQKRRRKASAASQEVMPAPASGAIPSTVEEVASLISAFCQELEAKGVPRYVIEEAGQWVFSAPSGATVPPTPDTKEYLAVLVDPTTDSVPATDATCGRDSEDALL